MTPAIRALEAASIPFQLLEYPGTKCPGPGGARNIGLAAADALKLQPAEVFKTLVAELNSGELVVAIIPVAAQLNMKRLSRAAGVKSARLAATAQAERVTGYVTGGISPIGQKTRLPTYLAAEAADLANIYVSAGKRGLELSLLPTDLKHITGATWCNL